MTSAAFLFLSLQCASLRIGSVVAALPVIGQTNPSPLGPCQADEAGEQVAVGGEGAGHGAQDACGLPDGQENAVSGAFNQRVAHV